MFLVYFSRGFKLKKKKSIVFAIPLLLISCHVKSEFLGDSCRTRIPKRIHVECLNPNPGKSLLSRTWPGWGMIHWVIYSYMYRGALPDDISAWTVGNLCERRIEDEQKYLWGKRSIVAASQFNFYFQRIYFVCSLKACRLCILGPKVNECPELMPDVESWT